MNTESLGLSPIRDGRHSEAAPHIPTEYLYRLQRQIPVHLSDYTPDAPYMSKEEKKNYYEFLRDRLGIYRIRTEFRMNHMIREDGSFDEEVMRSYKESFIAMGEAGLEKPTLVLFTPAPWMYKLARENPKEFNALYKRFAEKSRDICQASGMEPEYVQVMNEVNFPAQTQLPLGHVVELIKITHEVFKEHNPAAEKPSIITTVYTNAQETPPKWKFMPKTLIEKVPFWMDWRGFVKDLVEEAGDNLDGIGFDGYSGSWDIPALPILGNKPFDAFGVVTSYEWAIQEKLFGILKGKKVLFTETGAPGISKESVFARFGYDRMIQALDHLLLKYQREGCDVNEILSGVGFHRGADFSSIGNKTPGIIDPLPWLLVRKDKDGRWVLTAAARRIKHLIGTRLNPHFQQEGKHVVYVGTSESSDSRRYLRDRYARRKPRSRRAEKFHPEEKSPQ